MSSRFAIVFFIILALLLNIFGNSFPAKLLKSGASAIIFPVQALSRAAINAGAGSVYYLFFAGKVNLENQKLIAENRALKNKLLTFLALQEENAALKREKGLPFSFSPGNLLPAEVIFRNEELWDSQIVINRGRTSRVVPGEVVVSPEGLVGKVIEAAPFTSKVRLILDSRSAFSVKTLESGLDALAVGGKNVVRLKFIPSGSDLKIGEAVAVSKSSEYPAGIPVGTVSKVSGSELGLFQEVEVKPGADFSRLNLVYVVQR